MNIQIAADPMYALCEIGDTRVVARSELEVGLPSMYVQADKRRSLQKINC